MENFASTILEFFYILIGLILIMTAVRAFRDQTNPARIGTAAFWLLLGVVFGAGNYIPFVIDGIIILLMGVLTLFKQVRLGKVADLNEKESEQAAGKLGNLVFVPCLVLALVADIVAKTAPFGPLSGQIGIGIAAVISLVVAMFITKAKPKVVLDDTNRMIQQVGTTGILPQLLAALGVIFNAAGVGTVISNGISGFVPEGNRLIGVPFVIAQGADPVIAGALAMTAGFCGTLLTPMAANFNALPVALLEIKDQNAVIKAQAPLAIIMLVVHVVLMYFWAF